MCISAKLPLLKHLSLFPSEEQATEMGIARKLSLQQQYRVRLSRLPLLRNCASTPSSGTTPQTRATIWLDRDSTYINNKFLFRVETKFSSHQRTRTQGQRRPCESLVCAKPVIASNGQTCLS